MTVRSLRLSQERPPAHPPHDLGRAGEALAADWYRVQGYEVVARNWSCPVGEIDIIAVRGRLVVFCEVKARSTSAFGSPAEAVGPVKQVRLRRLAAHWFAEQRRAGAWARARPDLGMSATARFDVASVLGKRVEVLEAAF